MHGNSPKVRLSFGLVVQLGLSQGSESQWNTEHQGGGDSSSPMQLDSDAKKKPKGFRA